MQPEIRTIPLEFTLHGHSLRHDPAQSYGQEIGALLGRVWPVLKANAILSDGLNRVVYDGNDTVFAGVVLSPGAEELPAVASLERKTVRLTRYAVWQHIGPYQLLPATGAAMTQALAAAGYRTGWPLVEVYGHWTSDESKLETETLVALR